MQELSKGLVLFSALLSPLAMADWQLNVDLELLAPESQQSGYASVFLSPGEETIFLETQDSTAPIKGSAELISVSAEAITVALTVTQQQPSGDWATLATPTLSAGLDAPVSMAIADPERQQTLNLAVSITSS